MRLRVRQIDLAAREINLQEDQTKNGEARFAPLTDEAATLLTALIMGKEPNDYVFVRPDKTLKDGRVMKGTRVTGFRKRWWTVCCDVGLGQFVCPVCYPELQKRKQEKQTVDAKGQCSDCGKKWERAKLMYAGLLFSRSTPKRYTEPDPGGSSAESGAADQRA